MKTKTTLTVTAKERKLLHYLCTQDKPLRDLIWEYKENNEIKIYGRTKKGNWKLEKINKRKGY